MAEQRQVSILFADVQGFTRLRGAEVDAFVSRVLNVFAKKVSEMKTSPLVSNTWGDAIFLVFGTADQAAECALQLRDLIYDTSWQEEGIHKELRIRIALHNAFATLMNDPITNRSNAYGPHINMAARLEPVTIPNEVFATEDFKRALSQFDRKVYDWDDVGELALAKDWGTSNVYRLRRPRERSLKPEQLTTSPFPPDELRKDDVDQKQKSSRAVRESSVARHEVSDIPNLPLTELARRARSHSDQTQSRVFVVHGHDEGAKESVARYLERLGLQAVILHEQANRGRTIISKFREETADVGFAVILMTPDDHGGIVGQETRPRARQNVIFELGFLIGALGPDRVAALIKGAVERPSDFDGVVYIELDSKGAWRQALGQELQAAGYNINWNKVMTG